MTNGAIMMNSDGILFLLLKSANEMGKEPVFGPVHLKLGIKLTCYSQNFMLGPNPVYLRILCNVSTYLLYPYSVQYIFYTYCTFNLLFIKKCFKYFSALFFSALRIFSGCPITSFRRKDGGIKQRRSV